MSGTKSGLFRRIQIPTHDLESAKMSILGSRDSRRGDVAESSVRALPKVAEGGCCKVGKLPVIIKTSVRLEPQSWGAFASNRH